MANWIEDPQNRENVEKVSDERGVPTMVKRIF